MKFFIYVFCLITLINFALMAQVEISGEGAGGSTNGLVIQANNCTIKGLIINRFAGDGIKITGNSNKIYGNIIGTDNNSSTGIGNGGNGISIINASNNIIGNQTPENLNVISGNSGNGILITGSGSTGNWIKSNYIGTDTSGNDNIGNGLSGIEITDAGEGNIIGVNKTQSSLNKANNINQINIGNVIAKCVNAIKIDNTNNTQITNNYIGYYIALQDINSQQSVALGTQSDGIKIQNSQNTIISDAVIVKTRGAGIKISGPGSKFNKIFNSYIGTDPFGKDGLGCSGNGITFDSLASLNSIGGCDSSVIIVANQKYAIELINSTLNKINGVTAGIIENLSLKKNGVNKKTSSINLGNALGGLKILNSSSNIIGNPCAKNIFAANGGPGIILEGIKSKLNKLQANIIGTDENGTENLGNNGDGILLMDGAGNNTIGGENNGEGNISVSNKGNGFALLNANFNKLIGNSSGLFKPLNGITKNMGNALAGALIKNSSQTTLYKGLFGGNLIGIRMTGLESTFNKIAGVIAGTDSNAAQGLGNLQNGILIDSLANNNTLGGLGKDSSIIIAGNKQIGLILLNAKKIKMQNMLVGLMQKLHQSTMTIIKNLDGGVEIENSEENEFGLPGMPNMVAGNGGPGLVIKGLGSVLNKIKSSFFGTDTSGKSGLGNNGDGVCIMDGANNNIIGGDNPEEGNTSVSNSGNGYAIMGKETYGNILSFSVAGFIQSLNLPPKPLGNLNGLMIYNAFNNLIKHSYFSANKQDGGVITGALASHNKIMGSFFGTDTSLSLNLGNQRGLCILNGANNNIIGDSALANLCRFANNKEWGMIVSNAYQNSILNSTIGGFNSLQISLKNLIGGIKFENANNNFFGRPLAKLAANLTNSLSAFANKVEGHDSAGVAVINSSNIQITGNTIDHNKVGVLVTMDSTLKNLFQQLHIISNRIINNLRAFQGNNADVYIADNLIEDNTGIATGIHLFNSTGKITGNLITNDAGDGIALEDGSVPSINKNNIYNNNGYGVKNFDQSVLINAEDNYWGNSSGPGGSGSGSGDEVSDGVNYANWRNSMMSLSATAGRDTLFLLPGRKDTVDVFVTNFLNPSDVVDISVTDQLGWLNEQGIQHINLGNDSLGAAIPVYINVPSNAVSSTVNKISLSASSQIGPGVTDKDSFYVIVYKPQLTSLFVAPDTAYVAINQSYKFSAVGFDQTGEKANPSLTWSATGGTIDSSGLFTADSNTGIYSVTAKDPVTNISDNAIIIVQLTTSVEDNNEINLPKEYSLSQNYPNPFNPSTKIQYSIPFNSRVKIRIFNILGQLVNELVNSEKPAGFYEVNWIGNNLASGIYIYVMEASSLDNNRKFKSVKKMILLK